MKTSDAANMLGLQNEITPEITKQAYRLAAKKYHPDINPAGAEMMKVINSAYAVLKDYSGVIDTNDHDSHYPDDLNDALNAIITLDGIQIEICGSWIWVTGDTYTHKNILKENGFKYASKKKSWNFRPDNWKSRSRGNTSMEDIRSKYGSKKPSPSRYLHLSQGAS